MRANNSKLIDFDPPPRDSTDTPKFIIQENALPVAYFTTDKTPVFHSMMYGSRSVALRCVVITQHVR